MYQVIEMSRGFWILKRQQDPNAWEKIGTCADEQAVQQFVSEHHLTFAGTCAVKTQTVTGNTVEHSTRMYR